jgi:hypothetical protein
VWDATLGYARSANVRTAGAAAALPVLATIARRRLVQLPQGFHRFWGLPLLGGDASPGALDFAAAAVRSGQDAEVDAASWHPALLAWLQAAPAAADPNSVAAVVAALLKLPQYEGGGGSCRSSSGPDDAPSLGPLTAADGERWWQWWQEDAALPGQLAALIRGAGDWGRGAACCLSTPALRLHPVSARPARLLRPLPSYPLQVSC